MRSCSGGTKKTIIATSLNTEAPSPASLFSWPSVVIVILMIAALPSGISICTYSRPASPIPMSSTLLGYQQPDVRAVRWNDLPTSAIQRLLAYAYIPKSIVEYQETRAILNDLQTILCHNNTTSSSGYIGPGKFDVKEEHIIQVRNWMNMTPGLIIDREWNCRNWFNRYSFIC
jgi:hypothetical protein